MKQREAQAFLREILAHPEEDTPRLIFADWLEERGEPARAELIRVQIDRASLPAWEARQVGLRLRERALLKEHGRKWKRELPRIRGIQWEEFRRGFVATASCESYTALQEGASECWAATPLEAVSMRWPRSGDPVRSLGTLAGLRELSFSGPPLLASDVERLAGASLLSTVRTLSLRQVHLEAESLRRLLASPQLGCLRALRLPGNALGTEAIRALRGAVSLSGLRELDLSEPAALPRYGPPPGLDSQAVLALARWPGMASVRSLKLSGHRIGRVGLWALLQMRFCKDLKELVLRRCELSGPMLAELAAAQAGLQLEVLDLGENAISSEGARELARARCLDEGKVLRLDRCELSTSGACWLAEAPYFASVRVLDVTGNNLRAQGLQAVLARQGPGLHTLLAGETNLRNAGAAYLAEQPATESLVELSLEWNRLEDSAALALARSPYLQRLRVLHLGYNRIGPEAAAYLRDSPVGQRLAALALKNQQPGRR